MLHTSKESKKQSEKTKDENVLVKPQKLVGIGDVSARR